jgi:hypothetical protein
MGLETKCRAEHDGRSAIGKALLETDELVFRGELRFAVPLKQIESVTAKDGRLTLVWGGGKTAVLELGAAAEKWAKRIREPKGLAEKLGLKAGLTVSVVGTLDPALLKELGLAAKAPLRKGSHIIFLATTARKDLEKLARLKGSLDPAGAIWVIRPKGRVEITETDVLEAGRAAGLVDTKVVRVSELLTGEKLVIPLGSR